MFRRLLATLTRYSELWIQSANQSWIGMFLLHIPFFSWVLKIDFSTNRLKYKNSEPKLRIIRKRCLLLALNPPQIKSVSFIWIRFVCLFTWIGKCENSCLVQWPEPDYTYLFTFFLLVSKKKKKEIKWILNNHFTLKNCI